MSGASPPSLSTTSPCPRPVDVVAGHLDHGDHHHPFRRRAPGAVANGLAGIFGQDPPFPEAKSFYEVDLHERGVVDAPPVQVACRRTRPGSVRSRLVLTYVQGVKGDQAEGSQDHRSRRPRAHPAGTAADALPGKVKSVELPQRTPVPALSPTSPRGGAGHPRRLTRRQPGRTTTSRRRARPRALSDPRRQGSRRRARHASTAPSPAIRSPATTSTSSPRSRPAPASPASAQRRRGTRHRAGPRAAAATGGPSSTSWPSRPKQAPQVVFGKELGTISPHPRPRGSEQPQRRRRHHRRSRSEHAPPSSSSTATTSCSRPWAGPRPISRRHGRVPSDGTGRQSASPTTVKVLVAGPSMLTAAGSASSSRCTRPGPSSSRCWSSPKNRPELPVRDLVGSERRTSFAIPAAAHDLRAALDRAPWRWRGWRARRRGAERKRRHGLHHHQPDRRLWQDVLRHQPGLRAARPHRQAGRHHRPRPPVRRGDHRAAPPAPAHHQRPPGRARRQPRLHPGPAARVHRPPCQWHRGPLAPTTPRRPTSSLADITEVSRWPRSSTTTSSSTRRPPSPSPCSPPSTSRRSSIVLATLDLPSVKNLGVVPQHPRPPQIPQDGISLVMNKAESDVGLSTGEVQRLFRQGFEGILPYSKEASRSINTGRPVLESARTPTSAGPWPRRSARCCPDELALVQRACRPQPRRLDADGPFTRLARRLVAASEAGHEALREAQPPGR